MAEDKLVLTLKNPDWAVARKIDDFLPETVVTAVLDEFPGPNDIAWDVYHDRGNTEKLATQSRLLMGPVTRNLVAELNSSVFVTHRWSVGREALTAAEQSNLQHLAASAILLGLALFLEDDRARAMWDRCQAMLLT